MEENHPAAQGSAATAKPSLTFAQMTGRQKSVYFLKLAICILSFGYIFSGVASE